MTHPHFCANCGASLNSKMRFCESCGCPVTSHQDSPHSQELVAAPIPPILASQTATLAPKKAIFPWILLALFIPFMAGLGLILWLGWRNPAIWSQWLPQAPLGTTVGTTPTPNTPPLNPNQVNLQDFVGSWMPLEGDSDSSTETLAFRLEGTMVVADIDSDRLELSVLNGRKLEGYLRQNGESIPMSAELNQDKQQITFIVRPPYSEIQVAVAQRVPETNLDNQVNRNRWLLTEEEALDRLISLPEIVDWSQRIEWQSPMNQAQFEIVETTPDAYLIHVYETVNNPGDPGHTATFGWYTVNRQTGEVTSTLP